MDVRLATEELRAKGIRLTRQRAAVLAALGQAERGLNPEEILALAQSECPELGLTTVYRTIELLVSLGIARRVHTGEGCASVVGAKAEHGHSVVCLLCGRVAEFSNCDMVSVEAAAARETGFTISVHSLELAGTCAQCRASGEAAHTSPGEPRRWA
jgi:Fur family transcriptional regulator, ferric uptake regulator